jgi:UDP-2-acetamido-3-amino-2,3-dideoxy-glucuronate N-acetyltransferase
MKRKYYVNEHAVIDENVEIGEGTKIWHFTHVQSNAKIGKACIIGQNVNIGNNVKIGNYCKIQNNVSVYEGVELEDYVFCGPSMVFTNILSPRCKYPQKGSEFYIKTLVKEGATIGANATIICGNTLGKHCMIGAGAVVTKDVPDYALVMGNPARIKGWISEAGARLNFDKEGIAFCAKSSKRYKLKENKVLEIG